MLKELIKENNINLNLQGKNKDEVFKEMIDILEQNNLLIDRKNFTEDIYERESLSNTGIGFGIGIPHSKSEFVDESSIVVGISKEGIDYNSTDGKKVNLVFMLAIKDDESDLHLRALATISRKLMHEEFRESLINAKSKEEVLSILIE